MAQRTLESEQVSLALGDKKYLHKNVKKKEYEDGRRKIDYVIEY